MKIKWGGESAKGNDTWDFALVKANNGTAQQYCKKQGFTTPVDADWATVYKNLGWNVNGKDNKNEKICI